MYHLTTLSIAFNDSKEVHPTPITQSLIVATGSRSGSHDPPPLTPPQPIPATPSFLPHAASAT